MTVPERLTNVIIGSGEGGKYLAWHLAQSGQRTAVVERRWIGGSCPNINCLPSKNEIYSAHVADIVRHAAAFGTATSGVEIDMVRVRERKREMVEALIAMHLGRFAATGAELIMGEARFLGPKTMEVRLNAGGTRVLAADRIFLNLGTQASVPDVAGLRAARPLTNIEALELDYLPTHLIVLGGGYVGLELAQAYRRFGSQVTILERGPRIASREDPDVSDEIARILRAEEMAVLTDAQVRSVQGRSGRDVSVLVRTASGEQTIEGSDILVAAGRSPNTSDIGLDLAGVELDARGYIRVNDRLESTAAGIWAIGECAGSAQFTHVSLDDFRVIRDNLAGRPRSTRGRLVPYCLFTDPPLGRVGLSETEARQSDIRVRVATLPMRAVLRTGTSGQTQGFMKVLVNAHDDLIRGFAMIGAEAGEVMATVQTAMLGDLPFTLLREAILAHPTMAEGIGQLLANVPPPPQ